MVAYLLRSSTYTGTVLYRSNLQFATKVAGVATPDPVRLRQFDILYTFIVARESH